MKNSYNNDYINDEYTQYTNNLNANIKNYIEERLIKQIKWYDSSARLKQAKYKRLVISSIIATSIIPILSLFTTYTIGVAFAIIIAILSSTSSVLLSISNLCEFQKLWIQYRSNCEILKSILHRYFTGANEFLGKNDKEKFDLLVSSCEEYMTKEYETWTKLSHASKEVQ